MRLYILRHGEAPFDAANDAQRSLTDNGKAATQAIAEQNKTSLEEVGAICCSPLLRARQTAGIVKPFTSDNAHLIIHQALTPESSPEAVVDFLQTIDEASVLLVSHMPLVSELVAWFPNRYPGPHFPTSDLACLELFSVARGCGELQWLRAPQ